jgi:hypothetical protein
MADAPPPPLPTHDGGQETQASGAEVAQQPDSFQYGDIEQLGSFVTDTQLEVDVSPLSSLAGLRSAKVTQVERFERHQGKTRISQVMMADSYGVYSVSLGWLGWGLCSWIYGFSVCSLSLIGSLFQHTSESFQLWYQLQLAVKSLSDAGLKAPCRPVADGPHRCGGPKVVNAEHRIESVRARPGEWQDVPSLQGGQYVIFEAKTDLDLPTKRIEADKDLRISPAE